MWLTIGSGEGEGLSVKVEGERFLVGSGEECQLMVWGPGVKPLHAYFQIRDDGIVELHELEGQTHVNGHRIEGAVHIRGGEEIRIGHTVLTPSVQDPAEEAHALHEAEGDGPAEPAPVVRVETEGQTVEVLPADDGDGGDDDPATVRVTTEGEAVEVVPARERRRLLRDMRRATMLGLGALVLAAIAVIAALALTGDDEKSVAQIVKDATPQTVLVKVDTGRGPQTRGSGVVLDSDEGHVMTNFHVVNGGLGFEVGVEDGAREAELVAAVPCDDLALLKVDDTEGMESMELSSQDDVAQGDDVVALGYPVNASLEDNLTSTAGTVSVVESAFRLEAPDAPPLQNVVQIDVALSAGNSGGPLVNRQGKLVGVNTAIVTQIQGAPIQGQGYAIGVDRVRDVFDDLKEGRSQGWTGFAIEPPDRKFLQRRQLPPGMLAGAPVPGTAAADSGVDGFLVTSIEGRPVGPSMRSYCDAVDGIESGQTATFRVVDRPGGRPKPVKLKFE